MAYTIMGTDLYDIDLAPETTEAEVLRNVSIILSAYIGECPGWRDFGTSRRFVDKSMITAQTLLIRDVIAAIEKWEPRAIVQDVQFYRDDESGRLIPKITIEIME